MTKLLQNQKERDLLFKQWPLNCCCSQKNNSMRFFIPQRIVRTQPTKGIVIIRAARRFRTIQGSRYFLMSRVVSGKSCSTSFVIWHLLFSQYTHYDYFIAGYRKNTDFYCFYYGIFVPRSQAQTKNQHFCCFTV